MTAAKTAELEFVKAALVAATKQRDELARGYASLKAELDGAFERLATVSEERDLLMKSTGSRLDGYRELGAKCAALEADRDRHLKMRGELVAALEGLLSVCGYMGDPAVERARALLAIARLERETK